ncbi:MAG: glycosyltransferase family 2 protein [Sphingomicrobium sp.]
MSGSPRVSVVIPVHNRERMIGDAVRSVLAQTMTDFELIVVDDGSTDRTAQVVEAFGDPRVHLIRHEHNRGTPAARNSGLEAATGEYIAWLDSDDVARPERLELQARYLDANPAVALIGGQAATIRSDGRRSWRPQAPRPLTHARIVATLLFHSPMLQSSMMGRAEVLKRYEYRVEFPVCQDLDMYSRLMLEHRVANLPQVLIDRRVHEGQVVKSQAERIVDRKRVLFREALGRLGIVPTDEELERHIRLGRIKNSAIDRPFLDWSEAWLARIAEANRARRIYDAGGLDYAMRRVWRRACLAALRGRDRFYALGRLWRGTPRWRLSNADQPAEGASAASA